jgi:ABC-type sugar transport system ATPase subunit
MTATTQAPMPTNGESTAESLLLSEVHKTYLARGREPFEAVKGINLDIKPGELVALLGPSGCGKTTTLRMIAGLETVTSGDIKIGDRVIQNLLPGKRNVGFGFEGYALYPPLNVRENLAYGLKARGVKDANKRVEALAARLEITDMLVMRPASLSSGQKQRVALARALIRNPAVVLLDEPLSHLDAAQRQRVRRELKILQREFGYTTIVVTHDQIEALSLADRLAVMDDGIIQQFGTPDEVFDDPANLFVADFVGEPKINLVEATMGADGMVRIGRSGQLRTAARTAEAGRVVTVGMRPVDLHPAEVEQMGIDAEVAMFEHLLEFGLANVKVPGLDGNVVVETHGDLWFSRGDQVRVTAAPERVYLFDVDSGDRIR